MTETDTFCVSHPTSDFKEAVHQSVRKLPCCCHCSTLAFQPQRIPKALDILSTSAQLQHQSARVLQLSSNGGQKSLAFHSSILPMDNSEMHSTWFPTVLSKINPVTHSCNKINYVQQTSAVSGLPCPVLCCFLGSPPKQSAHKSLSYSPF